MRTVLMLVLVGLMAALPAAAADKKRILAFDPQFDASAADGQTPEIEAANRARLADAAARIAAHLAASPDYAPVVDEAAAKEIGNYNLGACGRCELMLGRKAGADFVLVTQVQKLSSMLINMSAVIYAVADGATVAGGTIVINADTDEDWRRAADKLSVRRLGLPPL